MAVILIFFCNFNTLAQLLITQVRWFCLVHVLSTLSYRVLHKSSHNTQVMATYKPCLVICFVACSVTYLFGSLVTTYYLATVGSVKCSRDKSGIHVLNGYHRLCSESLHGRRCRRASYNFLLIQYG